MNKEFMKGNIYEKTFIQHEVENEFDTFIDDIVVDYNPVFVRFDRSNNNYKSYKYSVVYFVRMLREYRPYVDLGDHLERNAFGDLEWVRKSAYGLEFCSKSIKIGAATYFHRRSKEYPKQYSNETPKFMAILIPMNSDNIFRLEGELHYFFYRYKELISGYDRFNYSVVNRFIDKLSDRLPHLKDLSKLSLY